MTETGVLVSREDQDQDRDQDRDQDLRDVEGEAGASHFRSIRRT